MMRDQNKQKIVFLWDLHEVVFCKSWKQLVRLLFSCDAKKAVLNELSKNIIKLGKDFFLTKSNKKRNISIADLLYIAEKGKNKSLIGLIFKICCAYRPIPQTVLIIKELKEKGFIHHIGSNIARPVFMRFKELYPEVFDLFEYAHVVDVDSRDKVIQKPDPRFFSSYLETHDLIPEQVLFIDNKKKNITIAKNVGLQTIHFKGSKQLKKELIKMSIL